MSSSPSAALPSAARQAAARRGGHADGLSAGQQRAVVGLIVALHAGLGYGLLQVQAVRDAVTEAAPIFVSLLTPPAPPPPVPPPPPPPVQRVAPKKTLPPAPVITAAPSPAPATFTAPPPPPIVETPAPISAPEAPADVVAVAPPAPPPPAPPKMIPASAVQYLEQVMPVYSQASARAHESGRVVARFFIDEAGLPRDVGVYRSSGFVRLDDAWVAALRKARFKPPMLNGQPISGWATAAFDFQL